MLHHLDYIIDSSQACFSTWSSIYAWLDNWVTSGYITSTRIKSVIASIFFLPKQICYYLLPPFFDHLDKANDRKWGLGTYLSELGRYGMDYHCHELGIYITCQGFSVTISLTQARGKSYSKKDLVENVCQLPSRERERERNEKSTSPKILLIFSNYPLNLIDYIIERKSRLHKTGMKMDWVDHLGYKNPEFQ